MPRNCVGVLQVEDTEAEESGWDVRASGMTVSVVDSSGKSTLGARSSDPGGGDPDLQSAYTHPDGSVQTGSMKRTSSRSLQPDLRPGPDPHLRRGARPVRDPPRDGEMRGEV